MKDYRELIIRPSSGGFGEYDDAIADLLQRVDEDIQDGYPRHIIMRAYADAVCDLYMDQISALPRKGARGGRDASRIQGWSLSPCRAISQAVPHVARAQWFGGRSSHGRVAVPTVILDALIQGAVRLGYMLSWRDLIVYNADNERCGYLGHLVDDTGSWVPGTHITLDDHGAIDTWDQCFVAADGEDHGWDTPRVCIDWSGFRAALEAAKSRLLAQDQPS